MNEQELIKLHKNLNDTAFDDCKDVKVGDVLYYTYMFMGESRRFSGVKAFIKTMLKAVFPRGCDIEVIGTPKTIVLFSPDSVGRPDHKIAFKNATSVLDNCAKLFITKRKFSLRWVGKFFKVFKWNRQMKSGIARFADRMRCVSAFFDVYIEYCIFQRLLKKNGWDIETLLVYCDVMPNDSYFVQKFNAQGKTTVTLQHGFFNINDNAWAYKGSYSTYFLANSEASIELARKVGKEGKMVAVGSPHNFNDKAITQKSQLKELKTVGVIMNSPMSNYNNENLEMIRVVQEYCKANAKKALFKIHPSDDIGNYQAMLDDTVASFCESGCSVETFEKKVDVAVVSASTVFLSLLKDGLPVFLYVGQEYDPNMFYWVDELKFTTAHEFNKKCEWISTEDYNAVIARIKSTYIVDGDIKENYIKAYKQIGIL